MKAEHQKKQLPSVMERRAELVLADFASRGYDVDAVDPGTTAWTLRGAVEVDRDAVPPAKYTRNLGAWVEWLQGQVDMSVEYVHPKQK